MTPTWNLGLKLTCASQLRSLLTFTAHFFVSRYGFARESHLQLLPKLVSTCCVVKVTALEPNSLTVFKASGRSQPAPSDFGKTRTTHRSTAKFHTRPCFNVRRRRPSQASTPEIWNAILLDHDLGFFVRTGFDSCHWITLLSIQEILHSI